MTIDEDGDYVLTKFSKKNKKLTTSDHNTIICQFAIEIPSKVKIAKERRELFNFRNNESLTAFKLETDNSQDLLDCFKGNEDIIKKSDKWLIKKA